MVVHRERIGWLVIAWAFYLSVGSVGATPGMLLMVLGTFLYLFL
jgi:hypothetical protein